MLLSLNFQTHGKKKTMDWIVNSKYLHNLLSSSTLLAELNFTIIRNRR